MDIATRIKSYCDNKTYCKITRITSATTSKIIGGYIVDYSNDIILFQVSKDFDVDGYAVFSIESISKISSSNNDKYYDKIIRAENIIDLVGNKYSLNLQSWETIMRSVKKLGHVVIIENEDPDDKTFDIGPITYVSKKAVFIRYFNARGVLDKESTKIPWNLITIMMFDDRYCNTFSRHIREPKHT